MQSTTRLKFIRWIFPRNQLAWIHDTGHSNTEGSIKARSYRTGWTCLISTRRPRPRTSLRQRWRGFRALGRTQVRQGQGAHQGRILAGMWTPLSDASYQTSEAGRRHSRCGDPLCWDFREGFIIILEWAWCYHWVHREKSEKSTLRLLWIKKSKHEEVSLPPIVWGQRRYDLHGCVSAWQKTSKIRYQAKNRTISPKPQRKIRVNCSGKGDIASPCEMGWGQSKSVRKFHCLRCGSLPRTQHVAIDAIVNSPVASEIIPISP